MPGRGQVQSERARQHMREAWARRRAELGATPVCRADERADAQGVPGSQERMARLEHSLQEIRRRFGHKGGA